MLRRGIADTVALLFDTKIVSDAWLRGLDALLTHYRSGRRARREVRESIELRAVRSAVSSSRGTRRHARPDAPRT